jgi:hypothetical protein
MDEQDSQRERQMILEILESMYESEESLYGVFRFLNAQTRNVALLNSQRIQERTLAILNRIISMNVPTRVVMSLPLTLNPGANTGFWDPEVVRPTRDQIERAVVRLANVTQEGNCAICQDAVGNGATIIRHCNHAFHGNCINEWFEMNPRCPVCRYDIRNYAAPQNPPASPISQHEI